MSNWVRSSLNLLISYTFMDREMRIKWHGQLSEPRQSRGSGAIGSTLGNLEFISQTDCVPEEDSYKIVDDLSILEFINLIKIGIASHNSKYQVPNDFPVHNQIEPSTHLKN